MTFEAYLMALGVLVAVGFLAWLVSLAIRNVSFVDSLWSLFFLIAAIVYALSIDDVAPRGQIVIALVAIWALRLSVYITARNWGEPEDHRYQRLRARNEPFWIKSLIVVFVLQAVLAWLISLPLLAAITGGSALGVLDFAAIGLWFVGIVFEAGGDFQLARFKSDPANKGKVLDTGLWRLTRHPNYFGDFCVWWSFFLFAMSAGGWWTIASPLLMSFLLLKVSGVALLEKTITRRRPRYADYIQRTNAFFPWFPKRPDTFSEDNT